MSADFWVSTQRSHWQFTKEQLSNARLSISTWEKQKFSNNAIIVRYDTNVRIYIHQMIAKLGRRLCLRQIILVTAEVYISRFLTKVSLIEVNFYMLITTAVYLACKICECPQHIRSVLSEARNCWPEFISIDFTKLAEFEFYLIEELNCFLILHHPYDSLIQLVKVLGSESSIEKSLSSNSKYRLNLTDKEIGHSWQIINDSYMTDLPLLYPPHIIAIASLHLVLILQLDLSDLDNTQISKTKSTRANSNGSNGSNTSANMNMNTNTNMNMNLNLNLNSNITKNNQPLISGLNIKLPSLDFNKQTTINDNKVKATNKKNISGQYGLRRKLSHTLRQRMTNSLSPEKFASSQMENSSNSNNNTSNIANGVNNSRIEAFSNFLAGSNVNLGQVMEAVQSLLYLYEEWQHYDEVAVRQSIKTLVMTISSITTNM